MSEFTEKKPALRPQELIQKLRDRNLAISSEDEIEAIIAIRKIGYFRLSGFFGPLQESKDKFKSIYKFSDILRLYNFDRELRRLTSNALKTIEIELKTIITDIMSFSHESDWYMKASIFDTDKKKRQLITTHECNDGIIQEVEQLIDIPMYNSLIKNITHYIDRNSDKEFIKKYKNDYGKEAIVPSWMMMECISFGELSRLFSLIKPKSQEAREISKHFGAIRADVFSSWIHAFVVLRNSCAHHSRIWNRKYNVGLQFVQKSSAQFTTPSNEENLRKFYGVSSCLLKCLSMIDNESYKKYKNDFNELLTAYGINSSAMGFPQTLSENDIWNY